MAKAAIRFKRVAEAFNIAAMERQSSESFTDLSELVDSFIEGEEINNVTECKRLHDSSSDENEGGDYWENSMDMLRGYLEEKHSDDNDVKIKIQEQVESACRIMEVDKTSPEFKRRLMISLREKGFDAGLCKSKWGKTAQLQSGSYEYIDINVAGNRYIVEVSISSEFELARSTNRYASLLEILPPSFVGKPELLKQIVRLMCRASKKHMKKYEMHVPPWRRYAHMEAKWFSSNYKRTIDEIPDKKGPDSGEISGKKRAVGFVPMPVMNRSYFCREACVSKVGSRVGNLAMAMKTGNGLMLL